MLAKLMITLEHPIMSMFLFQVLTAVGMIIAVGGIAMAGRFAIWLFYRFVGIL